MKLKLSHPATETLSAEQALERIGHLEFSVDQVLVGQNDAKRALLVGVLAREHVLFEGAPGCGKTLLAEAGLRSLGVDEELHLCSFHRDTRREDLLGAVVLRRHVGRGLERLSFEIDPGRMLQAPLVVLDNLSSAPGEALAPLLHLLGRRRYEQGTNGGRARGDRADRADRADREGRTDRADRVASAGRTGRAGRPNGPTGPFGANDAGRVAVARFGRGLSLDLPLETAVATIGLSESEMGPAATQDALEPSQLDRFALQVRLRGLVSDRLWGACREVIAGVVSGGLLAIAEATGHDRDRSTDDQSAGDRSAGDRGEQDRLTAVERGALQQWVLQVPYPLAVQRTVRETIQQLSHRVRQVDAEFHGVPRGTAGGRGFGQKGLLSDRVFGAVLPKLLRAHAAVRGATEVAVEDLSVLRLMVAQRLPPHLMEGFEEVLEEAIQPPRTDRVPETEGMDQGLPLVADAGNELVQSEALPGQVPGAPTAEVDLPEAPPLPPRRRRPRPVDVDPLVRAFEGRLDRGRSDLDDDPGGQPRGFRPMRRFDELLDADPVDVLLLMDGTLAGPPRVLRRRRRILGGAVVIARDVSSSMAGFRNDWASELICGVVGAAQRRRMRVGYLEFHQRAIARRVGGRLLHRGYQQLTKLVREARPMGQTNYEAPLRMALEALRGRRGANRHVVMLTDGLPILGDTKVRAERELAKKLGVSLHTVFIGEGESPLILDLLSAETAGLRFQAREGDGGLVLAERVVGCQDA